VTDAGLGLEGVPAGSEQEDARDLGPQHLGRGGDDLQEHLVKIA
jgi:hypothetical protein